MIPILVVEDEALIRLVAVQVLVDEGYTVYQAGSVLEAVALLALHPEIGIVFTDVNMPGLTGLDLAKYVAKSYPDKGILITSGRQAIPTEELPPGARFIPKPYPIERLTRAVNELEPQTSVTGPPVRGRFAGGFGPWGKPSAGRFTRFSLPEGAT